MVIKSHVAGVAGSSQLWTQEDRSERRERGPGVTNTLDMVDMQTKLIHPEEEEEEEEEEKGRDKPSFKLRVATR